MNCMRGWTLRRSKALVLKARVSALVGKDVQQVRVIKDREIRNVLICEEHVEKMGELF